MQRGANGLTVDDASRLDKKLDYALLGKAPRLLPTLAPQCHLPRRRHPLSALPLCWRGSLGCAHLNFDPSLACG